VTGGPTEYERWFDESHRTGPAELEAQRRRAIATAGSRTSIITPVFDPPAEAFLAAARSVFEQTSPHWEWCVANFGSDPLIDALLRDFARHDTRIVHAGTLSNRGIADNTNLCVSQSTGRLLLFLDHDDVLESDAVFRIAEAFVATGADLIYTDRDQIAPDGRLVEPFFKPPPVLQTMWSANVMAHATAVGRDVFDRVGGLRAAYDGAQDWDLCLRCLEAGAKAAHLDRILYHWRQLPTSTSSGLAAKPYVLDAQTRVVQDHLDRTGIAAHARQTPFGTIAVEPDVASVAAPMVIRFGEGPVVTKSPGQQPEPTVLFVEAGIRIDVNDARRLAWWASLPGIGAVSPLLVDTEHRAAGTAVGSIDENVVELEFAGLPATLDVGYVGAPLWYRPARALNPRVVCIRRDRLEAHFGDDRRNWPKTPGELLRFTGVLSTDGSTCLVIGTLTVECPTAEPPNPDGAMRIPASSPHYRWEAGRPILRR
jgi:Glycosyl transferase family 2